MVLSTRGAERNEPMGRRALLAGVASMAATGLFAQRKLYADDESEIAPTDDRFQLRYLLSSCMYGYAPIAQILPEVRKTGAAAIDIWPKVHGNQREQMEEMGPDRFLELLRSHNTSLGCLTQYKLGPFGLAEEMKIARDIECHTIVTGGSGPKGLTGGDLKREVARFVERMKPHLELASECGVTIAIENHGANLIESPDSLKWLIELRASNVLAIALAPYHLPQNSDMLAQLIRDLGPGLRVFYAWQHGMGCSQKLPKEQELLQLPGRGELDFEPIVHALKEIEYTGWTSIFMHPFPRGIPILDSVELVTAEINRARLYLEGFL